MADLRREIEGAFPLAPVPEAPFPAGRMDGEWASYFDGRSWRAVEASVMRAQPRILERLTPDAFRYFIAAYMMASIEDPVDHDVLPAFVVAAVSARGADARALTPAQRKVVARFLASHVDDSDLRGGNLLAALQHLSQ